MIKKGYSTIEALPMAPGIRVLPVVHGSVEYTVLVREYLLQSPPDILAVELPENSTRPVRAAMPHADQIPVITLRRTGNDREIHFIMEPLEPIVEALRSAQEIGIPVHQVDLYNEHFLTWTPELFPDTYALRILGPEAMYRLYAEKREHATGDLSGLAAESDLLADRIDRFREIHMASQVRNIARIAGASGSERGILLVCGIRHVEGIRRYLSMVEEAFSVELAELEKLMRNLGRPDVLIHSDDEEPLEALLKRQNRIEGGMENSPDDGISYEISVLSRESPEVLQQPAYFNTSWLIARKNQRAIHAFERIMLQRYAYRDAVSRYERESGELVPPQREKLFFRFARNWSIVEHRLLPDMYRLVMSARGFGNDNFARIMYDTLNFLAPLPPGSPRPKKLTLDELFRDSRLLRFRLKVKRKRKVPPPNIIKRFRKEKYPGEWADSWSSSGSGICSYPPEDLIIENFGNFLKERARSVLTGSEQKTVPFTSSLLDGIDYRETIRNLHLGKIYVKDLHVRGLEAGAVVIVFSEDDREEFQWKVVWWGEHNQESDMAFYSSPPGEKLVGPGIFQCRYGGLLMTFPPGRLHDIWDDEEYERFEKPSERLLAAAIEYNDKTAIVHLADKPPSARMQALASRVGQKIVHIPLSTIDPVTLGRVRRFHVLDSKGRRDESGDFIW